MSATAGLVERASRHYDDLLATKHLASTRAALDAAGDRVLCSVLRPCFVERASYESLLRATEVINGAILRAGELLARDARLRRELAFPEYMEPLLEIDREHGAPSLIARLDGFVDPSGVLRVIEFNSDPGFELAEAAAEAWSGTAIAAELAQQYPFSTASYSELVAEALDVDQRARGRTSAPVLGIVRDEGHDALVPPWVRHVEGRGVEVVVAPFDALRIEGGRLVGPAGAPIDLLLPRWSDLVKRAGTPSPVFDALRAGSVRLVNGLSRGLLTSYKNTFELLSSPEHASLFDADVAAALARHVPWTRVLRNTKTTYRGERVDLLPFVAERRERMVLKPSGGNQSAGVVVGSSCTDASWRQALKRSLHQKFVVQERVEAAPESFPLRQGEGFVLAPQTATFEPFVWNGTRAAGALVKLSGTGMHGIFDGCSIPPVWILGE